MCRKYKEYCRNYVGKGFFQGFFTKVVAQIFQDKIRVNKDHFNNEIRDDDDDE